jgi:hypothetical protein
LKATTQANRLAPGLHQAANHPSSRSDPSVPRSRPEPVSRKIARIVWLLIAGSILGGGVFLATWEVPPPTARIEQVLPDDQFPR